MLPKKKRDFLEDEDDDLAKPLFANQLDDDIYASTAILTVLLNPGGDFRRKVEGIQEGFRCWYVVVHLFIPRFWILQP